MPRNYVLQQTLQTWWEKETQKCNTVTIKYEDEEYQYKKGQFVYVMVGRLKELEFAKIVELKKLKDSHYAQIKWMLKPEGLRKLLDSSNSFEGRHYGVAEVFYWSEADHYPPGSIFWRQRFYCQTRVLSEVRIGCCTQYFNPDKTWFICDKCRKWLHPECLEADIYKKLTSRIETKEVMVKVSLNTKQENGALKATLTFKWQSGCESIKEDVLCPFCTNQISVNEIIPTQPWPSPVSKEQETDINSNGRYTYRLGELVWFEVISIWRLGIVVERGLTENMPRYYLQTLSNPPQLDPVDESLLGHGLV